MLLADCSRQENSLQMRTAVQWHRSMPRWTRSVQALRDGTGLTAMDSSLSAMAGGLEELEPKLLRLINGLDGMDAGYLAGLEQIYAGYGQQVAALENIMDLLPVMDSETAVYEGEPEMTTNTETMEGEYTEDHTESTTEETVDEEGKK